MRKINKKIIIILILISIISFSFVGVFAYYSANSNKNVSIGTDITTDNVVEIASYDDFFEYSKYSKYNDSEAVSNSSDRKILKLTDDIELIDDLVVTADVHLNLNNHKLDLNDHELVFRHGYAGCINIFGGSISQGTGSGKITIDLPNASLFTNSVTYYSTGTTTTTEANCINVSNLNQKYTAYSALYYVSNVIASDLDKKIRMDDFDTVTDDSYVINQSKFISSKSSCLYNSNSADVCSYIYKDLDLPSNYLSTDIEITYTSNATSVLSNSGKFTAPSQEQDVTLTVSINHSSWENPVTCDFKLHAVNLNNSTVKNNVAKELIKNYLSDYYIDGTLNLPDNKSISNYYQLTQGVQLPHSALGSNISYSYSMTDYSGNNTITTTSHTLTGTDIYSLEPNDECYHLVVRVNDSEDLVLNIYSLYVGDYETIARLILNKTYGGSIVYDSSQARKQLTPLSGMTSELLGRETYSYISTYGISALSYSLKSGSSDADSVSTYFTLSSDTITLIEGKIPPAKTSYVTATFTFGTGANAEDVSVDLYLNYLAESGDTISGFLPYYNLYDPMVYEELSSSFEMPFAFAKGTPYTCYDVATAYTTTQITVNEGTNAEETFTYYNNYILGIPSGLKISLYYNGQRRLTFASSETSLTSQLDSYLSTNNLTLNGIATTYSDAKYIFEIDAQNALTTNTPILLIYNYNFGSEWARYRYVVDDTSYLTELTTSTFKLCGGLFYNSSSSASNAVQDTTFFAWIYNNFKTGGDEITVGSVDSSSFIPMDWLSQDVTLTALTGVTNYAGIGHLTGITKVDLSGITLSSSILSSIATMRNVATLILEGCGITDITSICTMTSVKYLDVSNNSIQYFTDLVNMTSLEEVYVYGNFYNSSTDYNKIYGADGILNYQTYTDLLKDGIAVYNLVSEGVPQLYGKSDQPNDYARLKSIAYQDKLKSGKSITSLYSKFSTNSSTYNLENGSATLVWSYGGGTDEFDATYFMVTYSFTSYNLVVKYYVDRY